MSWPLVPLIARDRNVPGGSVRAPSGLDEGAGGELMPQSRPTGEWPSQFARILAEALLSRPARQATSLEAPSRLSSVSATSARASCWPHPGNARPRGN